MVAECLIRLDIFKPKGRRQRVTVCAESALHLQAIMPAQVGWFCVQLLNTGTDWHVMATGGRQYHEGD